MTEQHDSVTERSRVGLCEDCSHSRRITSDRGSRFYLCQRSLTDASFRKYPPLPMLQCSGYEPRAKERLK
jgi:hypothetical protein